MTDKPASQPKKASKPRQNPETRCQFMFADGRRCSMLRPKGKSRFCLSHTAEDRQLRDAEDIAAELVGPTPELNTAVAINRTLARLFEQSAANRIPYRTAALLAYIGQLLVQTVGSIKSDIQAVNESYYNDLVRRSYNLITAEHGGPQKAAKSTTELPAQNSDESAAPPATQ
jgi:hypothetical protein